MDILSSVNRIGDADNHIFDARNVSCSTGVAYLDMALQKILPTDLMVIGAGTGVGKTQILSQMAAFMSEQGKKVLFIALEAEPDEIEMRLRYQLLAACIKENMIYSQIDISYRNFRHGLLCDEMLKYGSAIDEQFVARFKNLHTKYPSTSYTWLDLAADFKEARESGFEAIFLDHIHFMDTMNGKDDNDGLTRIIKEMRRLNLEYGIPVITAAHLRKDFDKLVPTKDDYHGTSNISKVATICVLLAKDPTGFDPVSGMQKTFIFVDKARTGGFGNLTGIQWYSTEEQKYKDHVAIGWIAPDYKTVSFLDRAKYPKWVKDIKGIARVLTAEKISELKGT